MQADRFGRGRNSAVKGAGRLAGVAAICLLLVLTAFEHASCAEENPTGPMQRLESLDTRLRNAGITAHLTYTGETKFGFGLIPDDAAEYRGLVELSLDLDTGKLGLWKGGRLFIHAQNGHGHPVTIAPGGDSLPISDIDARDFTQVSEYGLDQGLLKDRLRLLVGKQNVNNYFCVNDFGGQFLFPSYTLIPTVPMPTFPAPALGVSILGRPADGVHLKAGIYDGASKIGSLGWDTTFDGRGGRFLIVEPGIKTAFGRHGGYGGHYRVGFWYHTGSTPYIRQPDSKSGNYGVYVMADQLIYKEAAAGSGQGLGLFFQLGWAPENRNEVNRYIGTGFSYTGLLPARDQDTLGLGLSYARLTGQPGRAAEIGLVNAELYYSAQINSFLNLQPDIQYFSDPGTGHGSGWAVNLRWVVSF